MNFFKKSCQVLCLCLLTLSVTLSTALAAKEVKLFFSEPYNAAAAYAEGQTVGIYFGALDFNMRNHPTLRGKYKMRWVGDIVKNPRDAINAIATGAGEFTYTIPPYMEVFDPDWQAVTAPGLVKDFDHFLRVMNTPIWKAKQEKLEKEKGFKILKWTNTIGHFWLWSKKSPGADLADLKGMKISYTGQKTYSNSLQKLGAVPVALPYTEVVSALQTNMVDGLTMDIFSYDYLGLPRLTKFMLPVPFSLCPQALLVNAKWWNSLPEKEREVMMTVINTIDVFDYYNKKEVKAVEWWDKNPTTTLVKMTPEAMQYMKDTLNKASAETLKDLDPKLIEAFTSTRDVK